MMAVAQCKMACIMLGISLRDQKRNTWICQHTETEDIVTHHQREQAQIGTTRGKIHRQRVDY